jgi:hypothetical protein
MQDVVIEAQAECSCCDEMKTDFATVEIKMPFGRRDVEWCTDCCQKFLDDLYEFGWQDRE